MLLQPLLEMTLGMLIMRLLLLEMLIIPHPRTSGEPPTGRFNLVILELLQGLLLRTILTFYKAAPSKALGTAGSNEAGDDAVGSTDAANAPLGNAAPTFYGNVRETGAYDSTALGYAPSTGYAGNYDTAVLMSLVLMPVQLNALH